MNRKAKKAFNFPQSSRSGTRKNSKVFIVAITTICVSAFSREQHPLKIQTAIAISETPINIVSSLAWSLPKILATIS